MGVVTVMPTKAKGDATIFVVENMDNFDTIICSGGDGTLNEVTTGYMNSVTDTLTILQVLVHLLRLLTQHHKVLKIC